MAGELPAAIVVMGESWSETWLTKGLTNVLERDHVSFKHIDRSHVVDSIGGVFGLFPMGAVKLCLIRSPSLLHIDRRRLGLTRPWPDGTAQWCPGDFCPGIDTRTIAVGMKWVPARKSELGKKEARMGDLREWAPALAGDGFWEIKRPLPSVCLEAVITSRKRNQSAISDWEHCCSEREESESVCPETLLPEFCPTL